jgi:hypothetical protein
MGQAKDILEKNLTSVFVIMFTFHFSIRSMGQAKDILEKNLTSIFVIMFMPLFNKKNGTRVCKICGE